MLRVKAPLPAALAAQDVGSGADVIEHAAGAACDLALIHPDSAIVVLAVQVDLGTLDLLVGLFLYQMQDVLGVGLQLVDGVGVGGMHGHGDGALHGGKVDVDAAVIVSDLSGVQLLVDPADGHAECSSAGSPHRSPKWKTSRWSRWALITSMALRYSMGREATPGPTNSMTLFLT